eukprot:CAMPEP_0174379862 /NCGR_PEP_ID=MMETSP0811_2-20130205/122979_1 /TAXON_ID=73025 ORGANISM="Eutreptiella gymnastica-like, Strain CCMP1594" /NCGR_SAMPLE_ID=MMETSP0811_2 /ASSEMBLY_ACC=CAM_ASM_000667 /LENGTH=142 /DNA_ID=CAMNT_0015532511 /DNA_START=276 /DNA_END=705 /DNA_ORIENTATION=+
MKGQEEGDKRGRRTLTALAQKLRDQITPWQVSTSVHLLPRGEPSVPPGTAIRIQNWKYLFSKSTATRPYTATPNSLSKDGKKPNPNGPYARCTFDNAVPCASGSGKTNAEHMQLEGVAGGAEEHNGHRNTGHRGGKVDPQNA